MQLNLFRVLTRDKDALIASLSKKGFGVTREFEQDGWACTSYFTAAPSGGEVAWTRTFSDLLATEPKKTKAYSAAILFECGGELLIASFGRAHFYIRPHCDYDFGIELAKRLVNRDDVVQTAARQYQGRQRKDIRSFVADTSLDIAPGSSVDYLHARLLDKHSPVFGSSARFGTSAQLSPDIKQEDVGSFLSRVIEVLESPAQFKLPRTLVLSDEAEVARYDEMLWNELTGPVGLSDLATNSFDLFGVDFVFGSAGSFTLKCGRFGPRDVDRLTMAEVKQYLADKGIDDKKALDLKIVHHRDDGASFSQSIKDAIDFICDADHVVLQHGRWLRFNNDYLEALDDAVSRLLTIGPEPGLEKTALTEPEFIADLVATRGYGGGDKNFGIIRTDGRAPTEAWDLSLDDAVFAVKFGTAQKLNYVVDQSMSVLDIIHAGANLDPIPKFKTYCLWLGYRAKKPLGAITDTGSIILKQKLEAWARRCSQVGYQPAIKLIHKVHPEYDADTLK